MYNPIYNQLQLINCHNCAEKTNDLGPGGRLLAWDPCFFFQPSVPCHHTKPEEKHGTHIFDKENISYRHLLV